MQKKRQRIAAVLCVPVIGIGATDSARSSIGRKNFMPRFRLFL